ncbi:MAG: alpha/beta hydrolase [Pirellulales bacterium]|nr:alpha/beta hydrolase [Pirellulales bacterium]
MAKPRRRWRWYVKLPVFLLAALVVILGLAMLFEESLIFFPMRHPGGEWRPEWIVPEDAWFHAADGTALHGWYLPCDNPRAVILFCHGNAGNVTHRADILRALREWAGASTLVFDYRGYGHSEGRPNEEGVLADARAARTWLAQRAGVAEDRIVLMGESIGGAVAVDLAAADGARGLVLENTFTSIPDVAAFHYPILPVRWLLRTRLDSAGKIGAYRGPLFQSHGDADAIVPFELGRRLFETANEPKQFLRLPGRDHNDAHDQAYYAALADFLKGLE